MGYFGVFLPLDICGQSGPKSLTLKGRTIYFLTACFPHLRRTTRLPPSYFSVSPTSVPSAPSERAGSSHQRLPLALVLPTPPGLGVRSGAEQVGPKREQLAVALEQTLSWAMPGRARHGLDPWTPTRGSSFSGSIQVFREHSASIKAASPVRSHGGGETGIHLGGPRGCSKQNPEAALKKA